MMLADSAIDLPVLRLIHQNYSNFLYDVIWNNSSMKDYNLSVQSPLFYPDKLTLNNNGPLVLNDSRYNFTVEYRICSTLNYIHYTLGKL